MGAEDDPLIATVNGQAIHQSYIYRQIESLPLGEQVAIRQRLDAFTESLIREEIIFQAALASKFASEPALKEEVKATVVRYLIDKHVKDQVNVTDDAIAEFYAANTSAIRGEEVRVSQILRPTRDECEALLAKITTSSDFEAAAKAHSAHKESAERGGDLGLFMNHAGPLGFETKLFELEAGDMQIFESEDGCHLIRVTEHNTPPLPPLENVAPRIRALLEAQQERRLLQALLRNAESTIPVVRAGNSEKE